MSIPGGPLSIRALTEKDREDVRFAVEQELDYIALSFVRTPFDVMGLRDYLDELGAQVPIISKIEKPEALAHLGCCILGLLHPLLVARDLLPDLLLDARSVLLQPPSGGCQVVPLPLAQPLILAAEQLLVPPVIAAMPFKKQP